MNYLSKIVQVLIKTYVHGHRENNTIIIIHIYYNNNNQLKKLSINVCSFIINSSSIYYIIKYS